MPFGTVPGRSTRAIFLAALEITDERERAAYVRDGCTGNAQQRSKVERLLAAHDAEGSCPIDRAVEHFSPAETSVDDTSASLEFVLSGQGTIDQYQLLQQLGEGGMGVVYLAQQTHPVKRKVALKLIKPGMDSREVIARFESERQTLAMMDHPNIAHVLDAGSTAQRRPYFVMELVRGKPITEYCDDSRSSIEARLRLFIDVCRAVQHAHQKGIIHRDLKPTNVMVTLHDGSPMVKIIDFGVAKALDQALAEPTLLTQFAQLIGTPLYMSPEQAAMSGLDVDTRSDVYSLGVLLYELLTGLTPFDRETLAQAGFDGMRQMLRENDPPPPSSRLSAVEADRIAAISDCRHLHPQAIRRVLRGELDWIVMRALEKDRDRRYESASAFAADIKRYLDDEPVQACPPSTVYRLRKLTRRHKKVLGATALLVLLMVFGLVVSSKLAVRASNAEQAARKAQGEAEVTAERMRQLLYASDVKLASQAWRDNDVQQGHARLARHIPEHGQRDLRGFEWHYLWKQQDVPGVEIANLGSAVYDIALAPDGELIAAAGAGAVIHLFDTTTDELRRTIPTHQGETNGIAFSPDSSQIAATGDDGTVRVWDLDSGKQRFSTPVDEGLAYQVRYSPDGKTLLTCGEGNRVRLWDAFSGESLGTLNEHQAGLETIAVSTEGIVAAGDRGSRLSLWDLGQEKAVWDEDDDVFDPISSVVFSDHGYLAHGTVGGLLEIMNTDTYTTTFRRRFAEGIQSLAFSPLGAWLAVGDRAGHLRMVPFEEGEWDLSVSREWPAHEGRLYAVSVARDGRRIYSGGADGRFMAWEPFAGAPDQIVPLPRRYTRLAIVDADRFVISGHEGMSICDGTGTVLQDIGPAAHWDITTAKSARQLFATNFNRLAAWDVDTGKQIFQWLAQDDEIEVALAVAPDGRTVCATFKSSSGDRHLHVVDAPSGKLISRWWVWSANQLDISPDGRWLAFDSNNDIQLYDLQHRRLANSLKGHRAGIQALRFSHDGSRLGSVSADRSLKLWSVPAGELEYSVIAHRTATTGLAMAPDNRRIATFGTDRMLRLWDGQSAEALWEYPVPTGQVEALSFSADGERLICVRDHANLLILDGSPDKRRGDARPAAAPIDLSAPVPAP